MTTNLITCQWAVSCMSVIAWSPTRAEELLLMGTGWESIIPGPASSISSGSPTCKAPGQRESDQDPGHHLSLGTHTIIFKVKDDEGNWSTDQIVKVVVLENPDPTCDHRTLRVPAWNTLRVSQP